MFMVNMATVMSNDDANGRTRPPSLQTTRLRQMIRTIATIETSIARRGLRIGIRNARVIPPISSRTTSAPTM